MTGIALSAGGRITGVDPNPETGGAITPVSGIGRAGPVSANGFSLRGRGIGPSLGPGGKVGESLRGRTTSGTVCAQTGTANSNPATNSTQSHNAASLPREAATRPARRRI